MHLVHAKITLFALDDPVVHYVCGFKAPSRLCFIKKNDYLVFSDMGNMQNIEICR